jgi:hypothetical protein
MRRSLGAGGVKGIACATVGAGIAKCMEGLLQDELELRRSAGLSEHGSLVSAAWFELSRLLPQTTAAAVPGKHSNSLHQSIKFWLSLACRS